MLRKASARRLKQVRIKRFYNFGATDAREIDENFMGKLRLAPGANDPDQPDTEKSEQDEEQYFK